MSQWYSPEWDDRTKFLTAAARDDVEMLSLFLGAGMSADTSDSHGEPALHMALRLGRGQAAALLIAFGADVNARGPTGRRAIHEVASKSSMLELLPEILKRGGDLDDRDHRGQTPLMAAILSGSFEGARRLLREGADPLLRDEDGSTAVYHLVNGIHGFRPGRSHREALDLLHDLLRRGVDPNAVGQYGQTALTVAAERGRDDVLAVLRDAGGEVASPDGTGLTPLQAAAVRGRAEAAQDLLDAGAPLDFFSAVALGRKEAVSRFLDEDPALAGALLTAKKTSALSLAVRHGHADVVRLLLKQGADPNGPDAWTSTLHSAVRHLPDPRVIRLLVKHGAEVDAIDGDGNTPLNFAARDGRVDVARVLLQAGADPNAETERGATPLGFAKSEEMRSLLRRHGGR